MRAAVSLSLVLAVLLGLLVLPGLTGTGHAEAAPVRASHSALANLRNTALHPFRTTEERLARANLTGKTSDSDVNGAHLVVRLGAPFDDVHTDLHIRLADRAQS